MRWAWGALLELGSILELKAIRAGPGLEMKRLETPRNNRTDDDFGGTQVEPQAENQELSVYK